MAQKKTDWTLEKLFGEVVAQRRRALKMGQETLAHRAGLSPSAIQKYEEGKREPRARAIVQLAEALEMSADDLFTHSQWVRPKIGEKGHFEHGVSSEP